MHTHPPSTRPLDEYEQFAAARLTEEKRKSHNAMTDRGTDGILAWADFCAMRLKSALLVQMADDFGACHRAEQRTDEERRQAGLPVTPASTESDVDPAGCFEPFREAFGRIAHRFARFIIAEGPAVRQRKPCYAAGERAVHDIFWRAILEECNEEMRRARQKADPALDPCVTEPSF